jgi:hypothetical protein
VDLYLNKISSNQFQFWLIFVMDSTNEAQLIVGAMGKNIILNNIWPDFNFSKISIYSICFVYVCITCIYVCQIMFYYFDYRVWLSFHCVYSSLSWSVMCSCIGYQTIFTIQVSHLELRFLMFHIALCLTCYLSIKKY